VVFESRRAAPNVASPAGLAEAGELEFGWRLYCGRLDAGQAAKRRAAQPDGDGHCLLIAE
jgi:hypothetical protein